MQRCVFLLGRQFLEWLSEGLCGKGTAGCASLLILLLLLGVVVEVDGLWLLLISCRKHNLMPVHPDP